MKSDNSAIKFMRISEINIFPIKSLKGISLTESTVERRGLSLDRRWMLVDKTGQFISQRECPKLAIVSVAVESNSLKVSYVGFEDLSIPFEIEGRTIDVRIWDSICKAIPHRKDINEWFSNALNMDCELVFMPDDSKRSVNAKFDRNNDIVSFADGYPLLIIGENSLHRLNEMLENPIPMKRFRPNLVVSGSLAFAEDNWTGLSNGDTVFRVVKPCARCVITTIDQSKGEPTGNEPLKTLAKFRMAKHIYPNNFSEFGLSETSILFGQNLIAENFGGKIMVGDDVKAI